LSPTEVSYPGVYIEEIPSGVKTIAGVSTSITAFVDLASYATYYTKEKEEDNNAEYKPVPVRLFSYDDYERQFGPPHPLSDLALSVRLFFENGGSDCYMVNISDNATAASVDIPSVPDGDGTTKVVLRFTSLKRGDHKRTIITIADFKDDTVTVHEKYDGKTVGTYFKCSLSKGAIDSIENQPFQYVKCKIEAENTRPATADYELSGGNANSVPLQDDTDDLYGKAIDALEKVDLFNLMVITKLAPSKVFQEIAKKYNSELDVKVSTASSTLTSALSAHETANTAHHLTKPEPATALTAIIDSWDNGLTTVVNDALQILSGTAGEDHAAVYAKIQECINKLAEPDAAGNLKAKIITYKQNYDKLRDLFDDEKMKFSESKGLLGKALEEFQKVVTFAKEAVAADEKKTPFIEDCSKDDGVIKKFEVALTNQEPIQTEYNNAETELNEAFSSLDDATQNHDSALSALEEASVKYPNEAHLQDIIDCFDNVKTELDALKTHLDTLKQKIGTLKGRYEENKPFTNFYKDNPGEGSTQLTDIINIFPSISAGTLQLLIADVTTTADNSGMTDTAYTDILTAASILCGKCRAFLLIDPLDSWESWNTVIDNLLPIRSAVLKDRAAVYYPRLVIEVDGTERTIGPAAAVAGVIARTDKDRGVWKAPAGVDAMILAAGFRRLDEILTDQQNGVLNKDGVNCIRIFDTGITVWGARTLAGDDDNPSEWKYVPIRRLALFIEESLFRGTKWVVFEPNDEDPTWKSIRMNIKSFLEMLYDENAFEGNQDSAYFVKCDSSTTTPYDRDRGVVNILVGFAPLKPAEFVIIKIQQISKLSGDN